MRQRGSPGSSGGLKRFEEEIFRRRVTEWFAGNARELPWRRTQDPYAILVSEMMCQQTQVGTVVPYFERWMRRFPDCADTGGGHGAGGDGALAGAGILLPGAESAPGGEGGGGAGSFRGRSRAIRALPGVGRYTAGAIAAFAYDKPAALVDANIARVLARVFAIREPIDGTAGLARVWEEAERLQPKRGGRAFNAGLMEIGALVCTPRAPECGSVSGGGVLRGAGGWIAGGTAGEESRGGEPTSWRSGAR